jgi:hypothetical protein
MASFDWANFTSHRLLRCSLHGMTPERIEQSGLHKVLEILGQAAWRHFVTVSAYLES